MTRIIQPDDLLVYFEQSFASARNFYYMFAAALSFANYSVWVEN